jgi:L-ascorbate metabolism protein UlaG (beta-lactamase superfamily)
MKKILGIFGFVICSTLLLHAQKYETDVFKTSEGDLEITFIGHGTLMMKFNGKIIHIDPVSAYADYSTLPKADLVLVTHQHGDHLDPKAIDLIKNKSTEIVLTKICSEKYKGTAMMANGDEGEFAGIKVDAVPAYNIEHKRGDGNPFHPKGEGNGYVLYFGDKKVYVAGDTENIPEMADLKNIDIAFLPMNLPYTMTPEMVARASGMFHPTVLYPYHFGNTDSDLLLKLLQESESTEVRIRKLN